MCGIFGDFFEEIEEEKIKTFLENLFAPVCRSRQWGEAICGLFDPERGHCLTSADLYIYEDHCADLYIYDDYNVFKSYLY